MLLFILSNLFKALPPMWRYKSKLALFDLKKFNYEIGITTFLRGFECEMVH